jgi:dTDP-4-amino-4,6-dideoxygalactose transaminase
MEAILAIATRRGLTEIEDAAHAHGSEWRGRRAGSIGHLGSFSFQSSKNLSSGEGGMITTSDDGLAERCRSIHNCGRIPTGAWYEYHHLGGNYRLGELQGALLVAQMDRLEGQIETRERNAVHLAGRLREVPGLLPQPRTADCTRHAYHLFPFRVQPEVWGVDRETVLEAIRAEGIPVTHGYLHPLHRQPFLTRRAFGPFAGSGARPDYAAVSLPVVERICAAEGAWLEQRLFLGTREDMDDIARAFEKVHSGREALRKSARSAGKEATP